MNLRDIRKEKGMTQEELALEVGVGQSQIARYEANERAPKPAVAQKIAAVLGFNWTEFYPEEGKEEDDKEVCAP